MGRPHPALSRGGRAPETLRPLSGEAPSARRQRPFQAPGRSGPHLPLKSTKGLQETLLGEEPRPCGCLGTGQHRDRRVFWLTPAAPGRLGPETDLTPLLGHTRLRCRRRLHSPTPTLCRGHGAPRGPRQPAGPACLSLRSSGPPVPIQAAGRWCPARLWCPHGIQWGWFQAG